MAALPTTVSRHSSAAQPVAVRKAVQAASVSGTAHIVVIVPSLETATAGAAAAARAFPLYRCAVASARPGRGRA